MSKLPPHTSQPSTFDLDDDEDGWLDMPIIRMDDNAGGLDEEDRKKYHYVEPAKAGSGEAGASNATGNLIDYDEKGNEWRSKLDRNESDYTRLQLRDDDDADEVHLRTRYLFDEDKAMTPLSQMQATKNLLTEAQRVAYVGLCGLACREMATFLRRTRAKEMTSAVSSLELWALKIMGRLYYHMELETQEQKMIESLAEHGVRPEDLVPSLMTTHTVANPEYDPLEAKKQQDERLTEHSNANGDHPSPDAEEDLANDAELASEKEDSLPAIGSPQPTKALSMPGVTTSLSSTDKDVVLDIRWTILCDLFLLLIADSVYDARSRVLLENVARYLSLEGLDVVKFEKRVTDALEIQESVEKMEQLEIIEGRAKAAKKKRYVMMGLATIGGGLVIGLSAGLLAPVIGAGLGAALTTIGVTGTSGFLAGAGGAAVITTGGVLTGSSIAVKGMARRTRQVRTFDLMPLHNNKRVNCIITVSGFMSSNQDDVRLPFSVLDPIVGDVFSVLWEPEMLGEMGSALKILTAEVLSQVGQTVLQATVMTALMSALQWPIILTKLGYLIDNPWSNALDRSKAAGQVLADVLIQRNLGVRPMTLIGFSLGARVIFYALQELAKRGAFGIVQDVFLFGATVTASTKTWLQVRSVIAGRFVNGFARNDWILNYLFRATTGGLNTVAGLRPVQNVPGLENVDITDKISGHMSYRVYMPVILDQLGFPVTADYFDEPEELDIPDERTIVPPENYASAPKKGRSGFFSRKSTEKPRPVSRPPSATTFANLARASTSKRAGADEELPARLPHPPSSSTESTPQGAEPKSPESPTNVSDPRVSSPQIPIHAGFDFAAIHNVLEEEGVQGAFPSSSTLPVLPPPLPPQRSESAPIPTAGPSNNHSAAETATGAKSHESSRLGRSYSLQFDRETESSLEHEDADFEERRTATLSGNSGSSSHTTPLWMPELSTEYLPSRNHAPAISRIPLYDDRKTTAQPSDPPIFFGSADGSISFGTSLSEHDPWAPPPITTKKPPLNTNPWQS